MIFLFSIVLIIILPSSQGIYFQYHFQNQEGESVYNSKIKGYICKDTINLQGNTYSYTAAFGSLSALPDIETNITIEANGSTIERGSGAGSDFRIILVARNGNLTLKDATISGGKAANFGGGIHNY